MLSSGIIRSALSDHFPIIVCSRCYFGNPDNNYVRYKVRRNNAECRENFRQLITSYRRLDYDSNHHVQNLYDNFSAKISNAYNHVFPVIEVKKKLLDISKPYINSELKKLVREKHKLKKLFDKYPYTYGTSYKEIRNKVSRLLKKSKQSYFSDKFDANKQNPKKSFGVINEALGRQSSRKVVSEVLVDNNKLTNKGDIANAFNDYFSNIGSRLAENFTYSTNYLDYLSSLPRSSTTFDFVPITVVTLKSIIDSLKSSSPGHDEIPIKIYTDNFDLLGPEICLICNESLKQGVFPQQLKTAKVVPIFKAGDTKLTSNYRPISLLNSFSKIIEKAVYLQIYDYLTRNNLLSERQYGFRAGLSTENAINDMLSRIYHALDRREYALCVMIDLSKAFDTLNRTILMKKLKFYGFTDASLAWFDSYFSGREQLVCIDDSASNLRRINIGVAQGSA